MGAGRFVFSALRKYGDISHLFTAMTSGLSILAESPYSARTKSIKAADLHPELFHGGRVPESAGMKTTKAIGLLDERAQIADFPGSGFIFAHDFRKMPVIIRYAQIHIIGIFADFAAVAEEQACECGRGCGRQLAFGECLPVQLDGPNRCRIANANARRIGQRAQKPSCRRFWGLS